MFTILGKEIIVFEVSGDDKRVIGTYMISDEVANEAPNCPVWRLEGKDMYIFNYGSSQGWRIGDKDSLTDGSFFFKSKKLVYTITYKSSLTQKKLYKKTNAIFSIYGKNGIIPWHFFWILT